ncbi:M20/M25/M40 family metallo-hydrolase [Arthrobacter mobilis]|uniref:M20/M25/M40 family metallo-hydrolase n=1 Tax=Arthrobacter mobilis TaxID=2724944 RepID=UPI00197B9275|nr:M20/M25/M40 family metallo-hydrolase [Arthrobacter mobilis]
MPSLLDAAQNSRDSILSDIISLVETETYSADLAALERGLAHLRALVVHRLGEPAKAVMDDGGSYGSVLRMTYRGTGPGHVLIIGHYDTVWPTGTLATWPITRRTDAVGREIVTGPGIFDMKAGLVQGIWALKLIREQGVEHPTVTYLFNGDEEIGSRASRPIIEAAAAEADAVLVLEPTFDGALKTGRKGVGIFTVTATGVEAHAGLNPTAGANAIHALAEFIAAARRIEDLARGTSVNVGLISGGSGTNVAAGLAVAEIDIRIESIEEMERVDHEFDAIEISDPRVAIKIAHYWNRPPMALTAASARLLGLVRSVALGLGRKLETASVGGGSDANFVSALNIPVLCGMGAVGDGAHARNEYIYTDEIPSFTALTAGTLQRLANGLPGTIQPVSTPTGLSDAVKQS